MPFNEIDDEKTPEARSGEPVEPADEDAEGHMFLPNDPGTARTLSQGRSADVEREMRERQRQKEARPNRP
jgi:hypothetical protein